MANLDTRSKRASSVSVLLISVLAPVLPDATIGQGDRQHTANRYSGILAATPAVTGPPIYLTGSLDPTVYITGSLDPALAITGSLEPNIYLAGSV